MLGDAGVCVCVRTCLNLLDVHLEPVRKNTLDNSHLQREFGHLPETGGRPGYGKNSKTLGRALRGAPTEEKGGSRRTDTQIPRRSGILKASCSA